MSTDKYDKHFQTYADIYFCGDVAWPWFKAMAMAESSMMPKAVSPVGASGLMQLMPRTSAEIARKLWIADDPFNPQINILMGIFYAKRMWDIFGKETGLERVCFMLGAYNAGPGNIMKAQHLAKRTDVWDDIAAALPEVTGLHSVETIGYVAKVLKNRQAMINK